MSLEYLAGFFDGEGSVGLYYVKQRKTWRAQIILVQNYSRAAERLFDEWAKAFAGSVHLVRRAGEPVTLRLALHSEEALKRFTKAMLRHSKLKARQLIVLDGWLTNKQYPYRTAQMLKTLKRIESL